VTYFEHAEEINPGPGFRCGTLQAMTISAPLDATRWDQWWLPQRPLATNDLTRGLYRTTRPHARTHRYVEANPEAISNLLVVDIDHQDALIRTIWDREGWRPNVVVESPSGRAHAVWALQAPIPRTEYGKRKPLAFAAAVTEGLRRSVDGDAAYSGLMTKNPESPTWRTTCWTEHLYTLAELEEHLRTIACMPPESWRRTRRKNPVGLGRNCALFETARTWAYREIRHHFGDPEGLTRAIETTAQTMNHDLFAEPLPTNEVTHIARSISRWITTRSRMWADGPAVYEATFTTIQAARGKKSGEKRARERDQVAIEVIHE